MGRNSCKLVALVAYDDGGVCGMEGCGMECVWDGVGVGWSGCEMEWVWDGVGVGWSGCEMEWV